MAARKRAVAPPHHLIYVSSDVRPVHLQLNHGQRGSSDQYNCSPLLVKKYLNVVASYSPRRALKGIWDCPHFISIDNVSTHDLCDPIRHHDSNLAQPTTQNNGLLTNRLTHDSTSSHLCQVQITSSPKRFIQFTMPMRSHPKHQRKESISISIQHP